MNESLTHRNHPESSLCGHFQCIPAHMHYSCKYSKTQPIKHDKYLVLQPSNCIFNYIYSKPQSMYIQLHGYHTTLMTHVLTSSLMQVERGSQPPLLITHSSISLHTWKNAIPSLVAAGDVQSTAEMNLFGLHGMFKPYTMWNMSCVSLRTCSTHVTRRRIDALCHI